MKTIWIQVQPKRAPGIDVDAVSTLLFRLSLTPGIRGFSIQRGPKLSWVNFCFESKTIGSAWQALCSGALAHPKWGSRLRRSSIVTCEGSRGWANYLMLHHFDAKQVLDRLAGI